MSMFSQLRVTAATIALSIAAAAGRAADSNRFAPLDVPSPFWVTRESPRLVTPQWFGEDDVEAVVLLAIDDMRDPERYETFLRPILDRLHEIEGRAPLSIMTNRVDPEDPRLQRFLEEGVTIECHTLDHPCPILARGDFSAGKATYDGCVDLLDSIPGNSPVAFRVPCMDSINSPSPRFFAEIFAKTTAAGKFLTIDSSICNLTTPNDPELPRELVVTEDGGERFRRYLPFPSFVNVVEDYPYPWVIGNLIWELPCVVPSDWEAQNVQGVNNPRTVSDLEAQLDVVVRKRGTFTIVFHPHGWIRADQIVELIDHATSLYGRRVRFLSFGEANEKLRETLLGGEPLRAGDGGDNGVRVLDLDGDGFQDVIAGNERRHVTRIWNDREGDWRELDFPMSLIRPRAQLDRRDAGARFGVIGGQTVLLVRNEETAGAWRFTSGGWRPDARLLAGLELEGGAIATAREGVDLGVRFRDFDRDGTSELIAGAPGRGAVFSWDGDAERWRRLPISLPPDVAVVDSEGHDAGFRFIDADSDGRLDVLFSNSERYGLWLFESLEAGWTRRAVAGARGDPAIDAALAIPPIVRADRTLNGFWERRGTLWFQNEDTASLPDLVDRRSLGALLASTVAPPRTPEAAHGSFVVRPGFRVELAAAEPLIRDPVAFDWDGDGRLWLVEMHDYPTGVGGGIEKRGEPGGRIVVLEDDDGDLHYDRSTVFLDGLTFPTAVRPWRDGALVVANPEILYAEDTDGDGRADRREALFRGFAHGNEQHLANGLAYGLDNWLHCANGDSGGVIECVRTGAKLDIRGRDFRIFPEGDAIDTLTGQTQFGRTQNDAGEWFGCSNPSPCFHFVLEDRYLRRNPHATTGNARRHVAPPAGQVFPRSPLVPRFNDLHMAGRFTSACGLTFYRDEAFGPGFHGNAFVSEPAHNLVHRMVITEEGTSFTSERGAGEERSEFLASTDPWFRPTSLRAGPDGALWIADMYREVIEHPQYFFTGDYHSVDVRSGDDRGRIWRVVPIGRPIRKVPRLAQMTLPELVEALRSPSGWTRDKAQELLVAARGSGVIAPLRSLALDLEAPATARLHALAALDGLATAKLDAFDAELVAKMIGDGAPAVRRLAIRVAERFFPPEPGLARALLSRVDDPAPRVALQLASTLGEWNDPRAGEALGQIAVRFRDDDGVQAAVLSSAPPHAASIVAAILSARETRELSASARGTILARFVPEVARGERDGTSSIRSLVDRLAKGNDPASFRPLAALLSALRHEQAELPEELRSELRERVLPLASEARRLALDPAGNLDARLDALPLIAEGILLADREDSESADFFEALAALLDPLGPPELREGSIEALGRTATARAAVVLLGAWHGSTPATRSRMLDVLLSRERWIDSLLDAIENGTVARSEIDLARRRRLLEQTSGRLGERSRALFEAADRAPTERAAVFEKLRPALAHPGDVARGLEVYEARCSTCHRLDGRGHAVGPDLETVADRSPDALLADIVDPNRAVEDRFTLYAIVTRDGRALAGIVEEESTTTLTLLGQDAKREVLPRAEITKLESGGISLMPEGLEADLAPADLASLIAAIRACRSPPKAFPGNHPGTVYPAPDGRLDLRAETAEIRGPTVVFEPRYANLGFWGSSEDHALWTIEVARSGTYEVSLLGSCPPSEAGDKIAVVCGGERVVAQVTPTKDWDTYREMPIGRIALREGRQEIVVRSDGAIAGYLIDLQAVRLRPVTAK